jgi:hypothetical protein
VPGEAKKWPQSKKSLVIPGVTRNPETVSPAQRAANFPLFPSRENVVRRAGRRGAASKIQNDELDSGSSPE